MVSEGFESDHPKMNHNDCTAVLSAAATGPIRLKRSLLI